MPTCPCCSDRLLRHIQKGSLYWFCRSCWAEMPNFEEYRQSPVVAPAKAQPTFVPIPQRVSAAALQEQLTLVKSLASHANRRAEASVAY